MNFRPLPSRAYLEAALDADLEAGLLIWKNRPRGHFLTTNVWATWNSRWAGKPAFNQPRPNGYFYGTIDAKVYLTHRILWKLATGLDPEEIDHIDGNPANNSLANLRSVERQDNVRNLSIRSDNTSGVSGVHLDVSRDKWIAGIGCRQLGRFETKEEAIAAREAALAAEGYHQNHCRRTRRFQAA